MFNSFKLFISSSDVQDMVYKHWWRLPIHFGFQFSSIVYHKNVTILQYSIVMLYCVITLTIVNVFSTVEKIIIISHPRSYNLYKQHTSLVHLHIKKSTHDFIKNSKQVIKTLEIREKFQKKKEDFCRSVASY